MRHLADVLFAVAMIAGALTAIIRPAVVVGWAKRAHPQLDEDDQAALWVAKLVGIGGLGVALFISLIIFRSFQ